MIIFSCFEKMEGLIKKKRYLKQHKWQQIEFKQFNYISSFFHQGHFFVEKNYLFKSMKKYVTKILRIKNDMS